jgi:hypothetical protein
MDVSVMHAKAQALAIQSFARAAEMTENLEARMIHFRFDPTVEESYKTPIQFFRSFKQEVCVIFVDEG